MNQFEVAQGFIEQCQARPGPAPGFQCSTTALLHFARCSHVDPLPQRVATLHLTPLPQETFHEKETLAATLALLPIDASVIGVASSAVKITA